MDNKKTHNKKTYRVSWSNGLHSRHSRCFNTEKEREDFIKTFIPDKKVRIWESEVQSI